MTADEYTPSTDEVRADYVRDHTRNFDSYQVGRSLTSEQEHYGGQFDRWLAGERARVLREAAEHWNVRWPIHPLSPSGARHVERWLITRADRIEQGEADRDR